MGEGLCGQLTGSGVSSHPRPARLLVCYPARIGLVWLRWGATQRRVGEGTGERGEPFGDGGR
jgi:hypothetical protein